MSRRPEGSARGSGFAGPSVARMSGERGQSPRWMMGPSGLIVGPVFVAVLLACLRIYRREFT